MGTRSDFYIGIGKNAEWIGSVAYSGMPEAIAEYGIFGAATELEFRSLISQLHSLEHFTRPEQGWPWPWNDSLKSDYAYVFHEGRVVFGSGYWESPKWIDAKGYARDRSMPGRSEKNCRADNLSGIDDFEFPDMRDRKNVALDGRSGFMMAGVLG